MEEVEGKHAEMGVGVPTRSEDCIVGTSVICMSGTNDYSNCLISNLNSLSTCVPNMKYEWVMYLSETVCVRFCCYPTHSGC